MKTPAISIVMPVYNAEDYLNESIDSILSQTFTGFELIIVDDGSTDNSINIIKSYDDSRIILIENPHDFIKSLNTGIAASKGKYIARMDADDIMLPHRLEAQFNFMEDNPSIDVCGGWSDAFGINNGAMRTYINHNDIVQSLMLANTMQHPTVIIRKQSVSELPAFPNLYKSEYIYAEDYKLWTDLVLEGLQFANIPEVILKYRLSDNQSTSKYRSDMLKKTFLIQQSYLYDILQKIIENEPSLYDFIESSIQALNNGVISFECLKYIGADTYLYYLKKIIKMEYTLLSLDQRIIHHLMLNTKLTKDLGLLKGKMGIAISFYLLSKKTEESIYADFAGDLLDEILDNLHKNTSYDFESGLSGIGWGIEYLIQNKFVDADSLDICEEIDKAIMLTDIRRISDFSLEKGLAGLLHYIMIHIKGCYLQKNNIPFDNVYLTDLYNRINSINNISSKEKIYPLISQYKQFVEQGIIVYDYDITEIIDKPLKVTADKINTYPLGLQKGLSAVIIEGVNLTDLVVDTK